MVIHTTCITLAGISIHSVGIEEIVISGRLLMITEEFVIPLVSRN